MKKLFITLFSLLFLLAATSCNQEEAPTGPGEVALNFKGYFGEAPLLMYERDYTYEADMVTKFQLFHFYVSDVELLPEDPNSGQPIKILDVDLVSFKDVQDENAARTGYTIRTESAPPGRYSGLRFGIGLSPELNKTQPGDYGPGHVLTDNYWSWAMGYVFFKIEGNADVNQDGDFEEKLTFHIGLDDFYRTKSFERPLEVKSSQTLELDFAVDLRKVLAPSQSEFVDFRQVTQDHTNDRELARFLADNLARAIEIGKD